MGLLSWLFPSPDKLMDKAQALLEQKEFARARDLVEELEGDRAQELLSQAHAGLLTMNIRVAVGYAEAGDFDRAQEHMTLAEEFAERGDPELKGARRAIREARAAARNAPKERKSLGVANTAFDGISGGSAETAAGAGVASDLPPDADPIFSLPPSDPRVRFALLLETYPEALRHPMVELGAEFATAVLAIEEGQVAHAVDVLGPFVSQDAVAHLQRARAASLGRNWGLAESDLRAFAKVYGHQRFGNLHTRAMLAETLAEQRRPADAMVVLDEGLAVDRNDMSLGSLKAMLLEAGGELAAADDLARRLISKNSRQMHLYKLMARVRIKAGKRLEAMQALEAGLTKNCSSGKCGSLPFDVDAGRMLARLYLEDRMEPRRAEELLGRVRRNARQQGWTDAYLEALVARNSGSPSLTGLVKGLSAGLVESDPRRLLVQKEFQGMA